MKKFARIISLICAILMLVPSLVACANTQGGEETTAAQNAQTEAPVVEETVDDGKDKDGFERDDLPGSAPSIERSGITGKITICPSAICSAKE